MKPEVQKQERIQRPKLKKMVPELRRSINMAGIIVDCNAYYAEKLGYGVDEMIGMHVDEHTPPEDRDKMHEEFEEWKKTHGRKTIMGSIMSKDGKSIETITSIRNQVSNAGKVTGMTTVMMDMKELKEFQKLIMIRKFESLYENSPDLYRTVNYNGTIVTVTRRSIYVR